MGHAVDAVYFKKGPPKEEAGNYVNIPSRGPRIFRPFDPRVDSPPTSQGKETPPAPDKGG